MINLKKFDFERTGECNNRTFYSNGIIDIIEHNCTFYLDKDDGNFYSDIVFKTDEDLIKYLTKKKEKLKEAIAKSYFDIIAIEKLLKKSI